MDNDDLTYSTPILCDEEVYNNGKIKITKKWTWDVEGINEDEETGILKILLKGDSYNYKGISTLASIDGKRLTTQDFDYLSDSSDGIFLVGKNGKGYGFIDKDMNMVIEPQYDLAEDFVNGIAKVYRDDEWFFVNKKGKEFHLEKKYEEINYFSDGLARVSTKKLGYLILAYHTDYSDNAGIYGYVDKTGKEVIKSQYIYAFDFYNDRAIVVKGKWTIDKKWDNECTQGGYWKNKELWGVIDKNGKEIIPCAYDEIHDLRDIYGNSVNDYYCVHVGGYQNGKWAIADRNGKFITEPIFGYVNYVYNDGLIYYLEEEDFDEDEIYGIYDLKNNKILFKPQFEDVDFCEDGNIIVEIKDKETGKTYSKIIKRDGTEIISKKYDIIFDLRTKYKGIFREGDKENIDIISKDGIILEHFELENPKYEYFESKIYSYKKNEKIGIKDFDGKMIIPAKFDDVYFLNNKFYETIYKKENDFESGLYDLDGNRIFEQVYQNIQMIDDTILCKNKNSCEVYKVEKL